jgi:hypothetical protein
MTTAYFVKILSIHHAVIIAANQRPDGKEIRVYFLKEGEGIGFQGDFDDIEAMTDYETGTVVVQNLAGGIITGREIQLEDIVGWAIEHGPARFTPRLSFPQSRFRRGQERCP